MPDPSYNRFSAIAIGGAFTNNIPTIYGGVSLDVSGHTAIRGNLYVSGSANIDVSGGGFSGTDLSLNGNIYLGGAIIPRNALNMFEVSANDVYINGTNGMTFVSNADMSFQPSGAGSLYFQPQGTGNLVFGTVNGGDIVSDAHGGSSYISRTGDVNFQADVSNINLVALGATGQINLQTGGGNITLDPSGANVICNAKLRLYDGIYSTNPGSIFQIDNADDFIFNGTNNTQLTLGFATDVTKKFTVGVDATNAFIGTSGTNMDLTLGASRFLQFNNPLFANYVYGDITSNKEIGFTQNTANPNTGSSYTGTASDTSTPAQVGTFTLPQPGVWLIQFDCRLTLNTGSDTITNREIVLSETSASLTKCAPAFHMADPIDDPAGSSGARQVYSFSGIYHNTAVGSKQLFINVIAQTSGSRTVTASGNFKFTRIA